MTQPDWTPLDDALHRARCANCPLPIWWRDDDAIEDTPALRKLSDLSGQLKLPVHIAVIPGLAQTSLAQFTRSHQHIIPLVHGWRHENHAPPQSKKAEFGLARPAANGEIAQARHQMEELFGQRFLPVFVPPWNRFDMALAPCLQANGFQGLSTFRPRPAKMAAPGIVQINTHIDPIDWHGTRDLKDPQQIIDDVASLIHARVEQAQDASEPLGYLTHHLVHSDLIWTFTDRLINTLLDGGAVAQPLDQLLRAEE